MMHHRLGVGRYDCAIKRDDIGGEGGYEIGDKGSIKNSKPHI